MWSLREGGGLQCDRAAFTCQDGRRAECQSARHGAERKADPVLYCFILMFGVFPSPTWRLVLDWGWHASVVLKCLFYLLFVCFVVVAFRHVLDIFVGLQLRFLL